MSKANPKYLKQYKTAPKGGGYPSHGSSLLELNLAAQFAHWVLLGVEVNVVVPV